MTQDTVIPDQVISTTEDEVGKIKNEFLDNEISTQESEDDEYFDESDPENEESAKNNVPDSEPELISPPPEKPDTPPVITLPSDIELDVGEKKPIVLPPAGIDLNDVSLISPLLPLTPPESSGAFLQESHITLPPEIKLPPDEQIIDKHRVTDEMKEFESFVQSISYVVEHPENPDNPDENDFLFMALHKALTQFPFEESYKLYQDMFKQNIWFKDTETGTFVLDADRMTELLREFFQEHVPFPGVQNDIPEISMYKPEEISTEALRKEGFVEFLNAIKPLVEQPENNAFQPFLDTLYTLAKSSYGYKLYNYLVQEGVWTKDETGKITFEISKLPEIVDAFCEAHVAFPDTHDLLSAILADKPKEISEIAKILASEMQKAAEQKNQESADKEENTDTLPEISEQPQQYKIANSSTLYDIIKPSIMESLTSSDMLNNKLKQVQEYMNDFLETPDLLKGMIDVNALKLPAVTTAFSMVTTYFKSTYYSVTLSTDSSVPVHQDTDFYPEEPVVTGSALVPETVLEVL